MNYLKSFNFAKEAHEDIFIDSVKQKCYDSFYPFKVLTRKEFNRIDFEPVTILYGSNGCGKTTALNIIAEKHKMDREAPFNKTNFMDNYLQYCDSDWTLTKPEECRIITSDDVFEYMLDIRRLNEGIDSRRDELMEDYLERKFTKFRLNSLADYEALKLNNMSKGKTQSQYVRHNVMDNVVEKSNGESGFMYFTEHIKENSLYLLDEPENSLSPERQLELIEFLENSVRFFGCQFIISTHSPFILSMRNAKIYNMDTYPVTVAPWTELKNVRMYYDFFKKHEKDFEI